jgi:isoleucyl-tRNA synthetase
MLSVLNSTIKKVTDSFDSYLVNEPPLFIESLFLELSRGYIQLIRDKAVQGTSEEKISIGYVLRESMSSIVKMFSTVCPFISEKIYQNIRPILGTTELSVHELSWPSYDSKMIDPALEKDMGSINSVIQGILFAREKAQLGVRWPVSKVTIITKDSDLSNSIGKLDFLIKSQANIKEICVAETMQGIKTSLKPNFQALGRSFGDKTHLIAAALEKSQEAIIDDLQKKSKHVLDLDGHGFEILSSHVVYERSVPPTLQEAEFKEGFVYLDTTRTSDLEAEGFSREITRRVQSMRKDEGMQRSEEIDLFLQVPEALVESLADFTDQMKTITGAQGIMVDMNSPEKRYNISSKEKIKGNDVVIFFNRLSR